MYPGTTLPPVPSLPSPSAEILLNIFNRQGLGYPQGCCIPSSALQVGGAVPQSLGDLGGQGTTTASALYVGTHRHKYTINHEYTHELEYACLGQTCTVSSTCIWIQHSTHTWCARTYAHTHSACIVALTCSDVLAHVHIQYLTTH